jgi:prepilin-type N-terminal cleavage/methylation domain-containing protein
VNPVFHKTQSARRIGACGFTLLEIIVALALITISGVIAIQLFSANLRAISASDGHVKASANAEALMRAILTDEDFPNNATTAGVTDIYSYATRATKIEDEKSAVVNADLYRVDVVLSWREGLREKSVTLNTLKLIERKL